MLSFVHRRRNPEGSSIGSGGKKNERIRTLIHRGSNQADVEDSALDIDDMFDVVTTSDNINALHLHLPSPPGQATTNIILPLSASKERRGSVTLVAPDPVPHSRPGTLRVRFRSRVRIGSGRHTSRTASIDSSPSSSISAPLRYAPDELENDIPQSYGAYTYQRKSASRRPSSSSIRNASTRVPTPSRHRHGGSVSEQTPLLRAPASRLGAQTRKRCGLDEDDDGREEIRARRMATRKAQEDTVFGKWPYRLLNGYVSNLPFFRRIQDGNAYTTRY